MDTPDNQGNSRKLPPQCWKPGQSGNPNGRTRKDLTLTTLLKEELQKICPGDKQGRTWRQVLVLAWLTGSLKNPMLLAHLLDRVEGKVAQPISGEYGGPVQVHATIQVVSDAAKAQLADVLAGKGTEGKANGESKPT